MATLSYNVYQQITSVRLSSTGNLAGVYFNGTLNNGIGATLTAPGDALLSIDGKVVNVGDRILLSLQTNDNENGIYVVNDTGSLGSKWVLERSPDFQSLEQIKAGQYFSVGDGATLAGGFYVLKEPLPTNIGQGTVGFAFANVSGGGGGGGGPFLTVAGNLTDVADPAAALVNLGTGTGQSVTITDGDFIANVYQIPVPFPAYIFCNNLTVPGQVIRLPVANVPFDSPALGQGPHIRMINCASTNIALSDGTVIGSLSGWQAEQYICSNKSTSAGAYGQIPEVYSVTTQSVQTGRVAVSSDNLNANTNFTPSNYTPLSGTGYDSASITGNLAGINAALSGGGGGGGTLIAQQLWVNNANGNDGNNGNIASPFKTYAAAIAYAAPLATATNQFVIKMVGDFTQTNLVLYPFVNIDGQFSGKITLTNTISLDTTFDSVANASVFLQDLTVISPVDPTLSFTVSQQQVIKLLNTDIQTGNLNITGSGTSPVETVIISNNELLDSNYSLNLQNINSKLLNVNCISFDWTNSTAAVNYLHHIFGCDFGTFITTATVGGTATIYIDASNLGVVNVEGAFNTLFFDSASYSVTPSFSLGANITNIQLKNLSDATLQTTYVPLNYTPSGSASFDASTVTGNFAGIDAALATLVPGTPIAQQLWVNFTSGNDGNNGDIDHPFKTYEAARLAAVAITSSTNYVCINVIGDQSITGDFVLSPYTVIDGHNSGKFTISNNIALDSAFSPLTSAKVIVKNCTFSANALFFDWLSSELCIAYLQNCTFPQVPDVTIQGDPLTTNGSFTIINGLANPIDTTFQSSFNVVDTSVAILNTLFNTSSPSVTASSTHAAALLIQNCDNFGSPIATSNSTGFANLLLKNCYPTSVTLSGNNAYLTTDVVSLTTLTFINAATINQISFLTQANGLVVSPAVFTPGFYVPMAPSANIKDQSIISHLKGIDNSLATYNNNFGSFFGAVSANGNVSAAAQIDDAYYTATGVGTTIGTVVSGTIRFTFTATASTPSVQITYPVNSGGGTTINFVNVVGSIYETGSPGIANGQVLFATALSSGYFVLQMRVAANVGYTATVYFQYQIQ